MDSNTHSTQGPSGPADDLVDLTAVLRRLASRDPERLPDAALGDQTLQLQQLSDCLQGVVLRHLAAVDARGADGAEQGVQFGSTAAWLRSRLRMASGPAATAVRTARALFRGPLPQTGQALCAGSISVTHAEVLAAGTKDLPAQVAADAEPVLLDAAKHLDPTRLRRLVEHLGYLADPDGADAQAQRRHGRRGVWLTPTYDRLVAINGLLEPEAGQTLIAALEPLTRPADAHDTRSGSQRTADALTELARRALEGGRLPKAGGVRPQLSVVVDLDSLLGDSCGLGGDAGWAAPLPPEACRRLACDAAVTRVLVRRQQPADPHDLNGDPHDLSCGPHAHDPAAPGLERWLRAVLTRLPPLLGGAPSQPLDAGRSTRVVSPAQRHALAVRDGGCVFPGCSRPILWCEAHHVWHWLDGGPTDLDNLALVCRAHHRAVHEDGWRLVRGPDGQFTATPPHRKYRAA